ncbi:MAG: hemerythrin domain-containing protein [Verrucomicrobiota bacterium]
MAPSEIMEREHHHIETVLLALRQTADAMLQGQRPDTELLRAAVEFLRIYGDRLHHLKEETLLFPRLAHRGIPDQANPIDSFRHDHEQERALVRVLDDSLDRFVRDQPGSGDALAHALDDVCATFERHLVKDKATLIPMAEQVLTDADKHELETKFAWADRAVGMEVVARCVEFSTNLTAEKTATQ